MKAASKESKAERQDSKPDNSTNFMEMYMMMQQERAVEERKREEREAERQEKRDLQFMTIMAALINPAAAARTSFAHKE